MNLWYILSVFENVVCVYRNFLFISKYQQKIVIIRIVVEFSLAIAITVNYTRVINAVLGDVVGLQLLSAIFFLLLILLKSFIIIIGGILRTGSYKIFQNNFLNLYNRFKDEPSLKKSEKILEITFLLMSAVFGILSITLALIRIDDWYHYVDSNTILDVIVYIIYELSVDIRYMLEHVVLYCAIIYIYEFLKCLNKSVHQVLKSYHVTGYEPIGPDEECFVGPEKIDIWKEEYQYIMICSKNLSLCFNELMSFSLMVAIVQCVSSMYDLIGKLIKKIGTQYYDTKVIVFVLIYHMTITIPLLFAGQRVQHEFFKLNKALARLSSALSTSRQKSETRIIKDLNRLVTKNPIVITFGTFTLGMYLLPMMFSLAATYIIVMLQFNHVI